ncbi:hypothetical protein HanXRQr2_Chr09g0417811 [Helianthus annuus]|uniref:Uncharacterized protein n=1 Tax=Helianthus annuus TaxID=4232 RepID=A0A251U1N4_HELAN|nr:hypothetical protein HanXRQr2_Chr09g0417811 [Helianthus annuus]KAJ0528308.1 hypothetical protein HanHA300_Chr09g0343671 [Helianthus annuus]KAJ0544737.1 hypothetical protein HanHA89_Chr09g0364911 [Helianthus annuus]
MFFFFSGKQFAFYLELSIGGGDNFSCKCTVHSFKSYTKLDSVVSSSIISPLEPCVLYVSAR